MMKGRFFLVIACIALAVCSSAQSITRSEYNGYSGERIIETSITTLKEGFSTGFGVAIRAQGNNYFLSFIGYGRKSTAIKEDDRLQFLLNDGRVIKFNSRVQLPSNESGVPNLYIHHYYISKKEVEALLANPVVIVRVVSPESNLDVPVKKKHAKELMEVCNLFLKEVDKF